MHGTYIKLTDARQAKGIHKYKNTKKKLYKCNAAIWYNKTCRLRKITPGYINIKINGNTQCKKTKKAATYLCINQEIKFLYTKKQKLNEQLYKLHLECATYWNVKWHTIQDTIDNKLQQLMESHYNHLNKKLDKLQIKLCQQPELKQSTTEHTNKVRQRFCPRVKNLTNINFTKEEMDILNYGTQYSIGKPITSYLANLIVEKEKEIKLLDTKMQNPYRILAAKKLKQIINKDKSYNVQQKDNHTLSNR